MNLEVKVHNTSGKRKGTLGWLLGNIGHVAIGIGKNRNQVAWLQDKENNQLTTLAARNYEVDEDSTDPCGPITPARARPNTVHNFDDSLYYHFCATPAAVAVLDKIRDLAIEAMNEGEEPADIADDIEVILIRPKDKTAIALAAKAIEDRGVVPILKDRLKEIPLP